MPLTPPNVFVAHTKAEAAKVNENFNLFQQVVNIAGDTLTGTLGVQTLTPSTTATYPLGDTSHKFTDGFFSGTVLAGAFSGIGTALTAIPETALTDGSLLARVADNETISGTWTLTANPTISGTTPKLTFLESDQPADGKKMYIRGENGLLRFGKSTDAGVETDIFTINRTTSTVAITGVVTTTSLIFERSRLVSMGETVPIAYSGGNFVGSGGGSWAVGSGDQIAFTYRLVGDTAWVNLNLQATSISSAPTTLSVTLPVTAQETLRWLAYGYDNGAPVLFQFDLTAASAVLVIHRFDGGPFAVSTDNTNVFTNFSCKVS